MKTEPRLKRPTAGEPHSKLDVFACNASAALKAEPAAPGKFNTSPLKVGHPKKIQKEGSLPTIIFHWLC